MDVAVMIGAAVVIVGVGVEVVLGGLLLWVSRRFSNIEGLYDRVESLEQRYRVLRAQKARAVSTTKGRPRLDAQEQDDYSDLPAEERALFELIDKPTEISN